MRLYLVRHGESMTNAKKQYTGWMDVELSENGRAQALRARERMPAVHYDRVISSDLIRAKQTCDIVLPGYSYETTPLLREINVACMAGHTAAECEAQYGEAFLACRANQDYRSFGGENREDLRRRVQGFLRQAESFPEENVAVFAHAGALRMALDLILEQTQLRKHIVCDNCAIAVFEYADGFWRLLRWDNDLS